MITGLGPAKIKLLNEGNYPGISEKVTTREQLKKYAHLLPNEARLSLLFLDGEKYSKSEADDAIAQISGWGVKYKVCGSYRRGNFPVKDLDVVIDIPVMFSDIVVKEGKFSKIFIKLSNGRYMPVDVLVATSWNFAVLHLTGSKEFNIRMRKAAKAKGWKLNQNGLTKDGESILTNPSERDIIEFVLGKFYPPQER